MYNMDWLFWVDIETTGLNHQKDKILQLAFILSDFHLNTVHDVQTFTLQCNVQSLSQMNDWCIKQHTISGLLDQVKKSSLTVQDVEKQIIMHLNRVLTVRDTLHLAGNSVHFDKCFIQTHMPTLHSRFTHKIIDVSSIGLVCKHLNPEAYSFRPVKEYKHTAESDILESIKEYKYYKMALIRVQHEYFSNCSSTRIM